MTYAGWFKARALVLVVDEEEKNIHLQYFHRLSVVGPPTVVQFGTCTLLACRRD